MFSKYVFYIFKPEKTEINYEEKTEKFLKRYSVISVIHNMALVVFSALFLVLPLEYYKNGNLMYSYGPAVDFLRMILVLFMVYYE